MRYDKQRVFIGRPSVSGTVQVLIRCNIIHFGLDADLRRVRMRISAYFLHLRHPIHKVHDL